MNRIMMKMMMMKMRRRKMRKEIDLKRKWGVA